MLPLSELDTEKLGSIVEPILRAARVPGAALAVVSDGRMVFAEGAGYRDLKGRLPLSAQTIYPIASTSKAMNATLIGMLVDEGQLAWDVPIQSYLPRFRLRDACISAQVTLRDLLVMRTGLPRHDWLWLGYPLTRAQIVDRLRHLEFSAAFREKFQYNNLSATAAGHVAEIVTGKSWEELIQARILQPLGMTHTGFAMPQGGDVTLSYHENSAREILPSTRLATEATAPSGGSIHSTVADMARWMLFNLAGGEWGGRSLIRKRTLHEIYTPQMAVPVDQGALSARSTYAIGWISDTYRDRACLFHGGYLHDVSSEVILFPELGIGIVAFINFGPPGISRFIAQQAFDVLMGLKPLQSIEERLAIYEKKVDETRARNGRVPRITGTNPSHSLEEYAGTYEHPGYGSLVIVCDGEHLVLHRGDLVLPLQHWHYDAWVAQDTGDFYIHMAHAFDAASRMLFQTGPDGEITALSIALEPAVASICFQKRQ